jgi:hypothetical protein
MNIERALFLFGLEKIDKKEIRKRYLQLCREYHPDKHVGISDDEKREYERKFVELQDAYICLNRDDDTVNLVRELFRKNYLEVAIQIIKSSKEEYIYLFLELLDKETLEYIRTFIISQKLEIGGILGWLNNKLKPIRTVYFEPSLSDMMNCRVYCLKENEYTYYIPLWHRNVTIEHIEVTLEPKIDIPNTYIDTENDLHIYITSKLTEIFENQKYEIAVDDNTIKIPVSDITLQKQQILLLKGKGLPHIDKKNIYDVSVKRDIYVYLELY